MKRKLLMIVLSLSSIQFLNSQDILIPESLDLFMYSLQHKDANGHTNPYGLIYGFPKFRLFGWSRDGKMAYSIETEVEGRGGTRIRYIIQDLVNDVIVWELVDDSFNWEGDYIDSELTIPEISFRREFCSISEALKKKQYN